MIPESATVERMKAAIVDAVIPVAGEAYMMGPTSHNFVINWQDYIRVLEVKRGWIDVQKTVTTAASASSVPAYTTDTLMVRLSLSYHNWYDMWRRGWLVRI